MDSDEAGDYMSDAGSSTHGSPRHHLSPSPVNMDAGPCRLLGLSVPITITSLLPPEFDPRGTVVEAIQREHHQALCDWGAADFGTIFVSVRTPVSKAAHMLRTTLVNYHVDHYEHLLATAVRTWATATYKGIEPTGPAFEHEQYGAVIGRGGQTIRSCSPDAKLVWDATNPLAGLYVVCVPHPTDKTAAWGHALRARLNRTPALGLGLSSSHPFSIPKTATSRSPSTPDYIITFNIRTTTHNAEFVRSATDAAFSAHTANLLRDAPRCDRGHWLLDVPPDSRIFPAFESSIVAAEFDRGTLTVALATKNWQNCRHLVERELSKAKLL